MSSNQTTTPPVDIFTKELGIAANTAALLLAPMEGITNALFREHLLSEASGPDLVATEFIRITSAKQKVKPFPRHRVPLQIQIMGCNAQMMQENLLYLKKRAVITHSDWLDLNVGCPSKKVTAKGAGSALLKTPELLIDIITALRQEHAGPLSIKTRIGYDSAENFTGILDALAQTKLDFITIHARTKQAGYSPGINLEQLAKAVDTLPFPVIGNGDLWDLDRGRSMLHETKVRGLMLGRSAIADPFLFLKIRAWQNNEPIQDYTPQDYLSFALSLLYKYMVLEKELAHPGRYVGAFKEFFFWLSQNPCLGKAYFQELKLCASLAEAERLLEGWMACQTTP